MEAEKGGASASGAAKLIGCHFGVWLVFLGHTMKVLTIILFVAVPSLAAWNVFSEMAYKLNMADLITQLDEAQKSQKDAEREMNVAQDQSETAYVNLHKVQRQLTEQKQRADQLADELADHRLEIERASAENQVLMRITQNQPAQKKRIAQLEAASKALNTRYDLKLAEYQTFVEKTAQALAAKDKRISELNAELSAAQNKN